MPPKLKLYLHPDIRRTRALLQGLDISRCIIDWKQRVDGISVTLLFAPHHVEFQPAPADPNAVLKAPEDFPFATARETMATALALDEVLMRSYIDNIACKLMDWLPALQATKQTRDDLAVEILDLIFSKTEGAQS